MVEKFSEMSTGYLVYNQNWKFVEYISLVGFNKNSGYPNGYNFIEVISLGNDKFINDQRKILEVAIDASDDNLTFENIISSQQANKVLSELIEDIKNIQKD